MMKRVDVLSFCLMVCMGTVIFLGGCSHESDDIPTKITTGNVLMKGAWDDYLGGNFNSAITKFRQVLARDATITEAYVGLGWSYTAAGTFDKALNNLTFAESRPDFLEYESDVYGGYASTYSASAEDSLAIIYAQKTLDTDQNWVFRADSTITFYDLHVMIAQASFKSKKYTAAVEKVDYLDPGWSEQFPTTGVTQTVTSLDVSSDSTWAILRVPHAGVSEIQSLVSEAAVASVPASKSGNIGTGSISEITVSDEHTLTEYWTVTCIDSVRDGGIFSVVGSVSGSLADYDITTGRYNSDPVTFTIRDGRPNFSVGDAFSFATTEANTPLTLEQVKEGNRIFVSGATFFSDIDYEIAVEYSYFDDFGNFLVNLMEKINSLF